MPVNKVEILTCGKCQQDIGYINLWSDYGQIFKTASFRCLACMELERYSVKLGAENNKIAGLPNLPENMAKIKKAKERKIEHLNSLIEELNQQKEAIKISKN